MGRQAEGTRVALSPEAVAGSANGWWSRPSAVACDIAEAAVRGSGSATARLGGVLLEVESDWDLLLDRLKQFYEPGPERSREASEAPAVRWRVRACPRSPMVLLTRPAPLPSGTVDLALALLRHPRGRPVYDAREAPEPSWRLVGSMATPAQPLMAVGGADVLVDRLLAEDVHAAPGFLVNFLVAATMKAQREVLFLHGASVGIRQEGVLLLGSGGAGKSTLALTLAGRGHSLFGDDVAAIRITSGEILPFRKAPKIRPGVRVRVIERMLADGVYRAERAFDGTEHFVIRPGAVPGFATEAAVLRFAFFLRRFSDRAALTPLRPADHPGLVKPLLYEVTVDASWGFFNAHRVMRFLKAAEVLSTARCYALDVGLPEETASLIEATVAGASWE